MAKTNRFASGDLVSGKKWNGEHFIGVYEHEYDCGDHAVFDGEKHLCVHKKDCHLANEEEAKVIKETIVKASQLKIADYVKKPFVPEDLIARVEKHLHPPIEDPEVNDIFKALDNLGL
jgi:hypothetical protein